MKNKLIKTTYSYDDIKFIISRFLSIKKLVNELNDHTGRRFTIDGHLFGSIGEALAAYLFDIKLNIAQSNGGYDGIAKDNKLVEVKIRSKTTGSIILNNATITQIKKSPMYLILFVYDANLSQLEEPKCYKITKDIIGKLKNNMISFRDLENNLEDYALLYRKNAFKKVNILLSAKLDSLDIC